MADDVVVLRTYANEMEARMDAMTLEANEIPAQVFVDTAGGALPSMALVFPIRLLVRSEDAEAARGLLDTAVDVFDSDDPTE